MISELDLLGLHVAFDTLDHPILQQSMKLQTGIKGYADDTQPYLTMKAEETHQLANLQAYLEHATNWMSHYFLMLNSDKLNSFCWALKT